MDDRLENRVAVVTGGGAGIGEATCRRFAEAGADVVVVDWHGDDAREVTEAIEAEWNRDILAIEADVSDEAAVERMAARVEERFGGADVLVNNAAIRVEPRPVTEADEASWNEIIGVNLKGAAFCAKHVVPLMKEGAVVNVASVGAAVARAGWSQYDATKGGIVAMTRDMACDHAPEIRVNAVSPGWVITDYHLPEDEEEAERFLAEKTTPGGAEAGILKRAAEPREVADAICFLASEEASFVTGIEFPVDGGASVVGPI